MIPGAIVKVIHVSTLSLQRFDLLHSKIFVSVPVSVFISNHEILKDAMSVGCAIRGEDSSLAWSEA
jgi:hypothetical protein